MNTRREFLQGAFSATLLGASGSGLAASAGGARRLRLGVISDIHISGGVKDCTAAALAKATQTLVQALRWFDRQGVDAVVVPGDLADMGRVEELQAVADAWKEVFPRNRGADGRPVEHLLIYGNHESYPSAARGGRAIWTEGRDKVWQEVFGEPFADLRVKTVKGYDFLLASWGWETSKSGGIGRFADLAASCAAKGRPFFEVQHAHPKDTCHGPNAWGHDDGRTAAVLAKYPNAVALSGHSHLHLGDERAVWQKGFTSIGCGSFRYTGQNDEDFAPLGPENGNMPVRCPAGATIQGEKMMGYRDALQLFTCHQGLVLDLYDDGLVVRRHEFSTGEDLGADWEVPLPAKAGGPFDPAKRPSLFPLCEYAETAELKVGSIEPRKNRFGDRHAVMTLTVPCGRHTKGAELAALDVGFVRAKGGFTHLTYVIPSDFNWPKGHKSGRMSVQVLADRLPEGASWAVCPMDCFGRVGKPLVAAGSAGGL